MELLRHVVSAVALPLPGLGDVNGADKLFVFAVGHAYLLECPDMFLVFFGHWAADGGTCPFAGQFLHCSCSG